MTTTTSPTLDVKVYSTHGQVELLVLDYDGFTVLTPAEARHIAAALIAAATAADKDLEEG